MNSNIKNENYILVSENLSFKDFQYMVAKNLNVKPPKKEAKPWLLNIAWRLDWLRHKLTGSRRRFVKHTAKSATSVTKYDNSKIKDEIGFEFKSIDQSIKEVCDLYLKDLKLK